MKPCRPPGLEKWLLPTYVMEYAWVASPLFGNANCKLFPPQDDCLRCRVHPYCCSTSLLNQEETPPLPTHTPCASTWPRNPFSPLAPIFPHIHLRHIQHRHATAAWQGGQIRQAWWERLWTMSPGHPLDSRDFQPHPPPFFSFLRMRLIRATILASG